LQLDPKVPTVSIICASYNKGAFIGETLESVLRQTYGEFEIIVSDDASTDGSVATITAYAGRDARVVAIFSDINKGGAHSRNEALKRARGEYVMFLDADDILLENCLASRLRFAKSHSQGNIWIFPMGVFVQKPGDDNRVWMPPKSGFLRRFLSHRLPWSIVQPLWRKSLLDEIGQFDERFERLQDVELHTRALLSQGTKVRVSGGAPDCLYRVSSNRLTTDAGRFLERWARAANLYYHTFYFKVPEAERSNLIGTLIEAYLNVLFRFGQAVISKENVRMLAGMLFTGVELSRTARTLIALLRLNAASNIRVKGLNAAIKSVLFAMRDPAHPASRA
jgi:glycosyltransferase involved in cell wall biosynthesis